MSISKQAPWRGLYAVPAVPFNEDLSIDYDAFGEHVSWLAEKGVDGICPSGSLGEYQTLTPEERARVVEVSVAAAPEGFGVMPGAAAYGALEVVRWVEQAANAGAQSILLLPPNGYRADREGVLSHYRAAAKVGLPIVAYNNPHDTKVDLTPGLLAALHEEGLIQAVKEFSGDVRRAYEIKELAPDLDLLIGTDDVVIELGVAGAVGWIAAYPNILPDTCVKLYKLATSGNFQDLHEAVPIYRDLHPLLRWDSHYEFVQVTKLSLDIIGRKGGPCRPPRGPLSAESAEIVRRDTEKALAKGYS
jgi:dihydrodipicolinate synthase/N-acetylneuraminate lyase